jgi:predicted type IV restriction endonuclease
MRYGKITAHPSERGTTMPVDIKRPLKKFLPIFLQARDANLNEADTVQRLIKFFEDVLGYDAINEISREAEMKGKYVDIVLKIDGAIRILVEAKAAGEKLRERHIEQAQAYASRNNYKWVVLTNGVDWNLYHLTFGEGIDYQRAFSVDLAEASKVDEASSFLGLLHRQAVKKGELEDFWRKATALGAKSIGKALFCEDVLNVVRREIRRAEGLNVDIEDLAESLHDMLTAEAREVIGPLKIRKKKPAVKKASPVPAVTDSQQPAAPETPATDEPARSESEPELA